MIRAEEFKRLLFLALETHNVYVDGGFGVRLDGKQLERYTTNNKYNREHAEEIIKEATTPPLPTWGWDCGGLHKGIIWGWVGDESKQWGGLHYQSAGLPDVAVNKYFKEYCYDQHDIDGVPPPITAVWIDGHIGTHIADGLAIEATRRSGNVRIVRIAGVGKEKKYPERKFEKWGYHSLVDYSPLVGDVNGDGKVDAKDYMMLKRIVLGTYNPSPEELQRADVNGDGEVDAKDYMILKRMVLGNE